MVRPLLISLLLPTYLEIGRNAVEQNGHYNGQIGQLVVWNKVLSLEEIEQYRTNPLQGSEDNLIAYYDFNEGEGDVLIDLSKNGNNGMIVGHNGVMMRQMLAVHSWIILLYSEEELLDNISIIGSNG